ncbi:MAG: hypothetical protein ACRDQ5_19265, partial [Sciscionella sp.]
GVFDAVVGNVPFGSVRPVDRRHNTGEHSLHNYFIVKSLALTTPGGIVAVLTSRYTLDSVNPAARRDMAAMADLVGAVRLPGGAHRRAAGTEAITDLLVLRRRGPDEDPDTRVAWERARAAGWLAEGQLKVNEYFLEHPEMVLGTMDAGRAQYRDHDLVVTADDGTPLAEQLRAALTAVASHAQDAGLTWNPATAGAGRGAPAEATSALLPAGSEVQEGHLLTHGGGFRRVVDGVLVEHKAPKNQHAELRALLGLRDTTVALLRRESTQLEDTPELDALRAQLNRRYDAYIGRYGPINRFTWRRTGRVDKATGEEKLARIRPTLGGFRSDPHAPAVFALEHFNSITHTASKADVFTRRVMAPRLPAQGADTPAEALTICLDTHGEVRLGEIARLLGVEAGEARTMLGTLVFDDPDADETNVEGLVSAADYLSGNVRKKLVRAQDAALDDERYAPNVPALREVIPPDLTPAEIAVRLGAIWVGASYVQQFLRETLGDPRLTVEHARGAGWSLERASHEGVRATQVWGTVRFPAPRLVENLLNQRPVLVRDNVGTPAEPKYVINPEETAKAAEKGQELNDRFRDWCW